MRADHRGAAPEAWEADWHVRYVPPEPQVPPVLPVTPVMVAVPSVMTLAMTPAPPTPGVMSPSCPPETTNPQFHEGPPDNELLQPACTRVRTRAHHNATTAAGPADHAFYFNQRPNNSPPPLLTRNANELSEPATYQEAMDSE